MRGNEDLYGALDILTQSSYWEGEADKYRVEIILYYKDGSTDMDNPYLRKQETLIYVHPDVDFDTLENFIYYFLMGRDCDTDWDRRSVHDVRLQTLSLARLEGLCG
jgi:hypothetical protein